MRFSSPAESPPSLLQAKDPRRILDRVETQSGPNAQYFDGWYADMARSPVKDEIAQRHLGLPPYLLSTSLLG